jgi:type I restriction enzyme S subunit
MKIKEFSEINPSPSCPIQGRHIINYIDTSSVIEGRLYDVQQLVKTFPSRAQREIRTQDILISSVRPNLKHNYFVEENANGMIASSGFIHIRVKDSIKISPRFLYYYLTSPSQVNRYIKIADSSQSAYPSFNKDIIEEIEFPNIDLSTQLRIAAIIARINHYFESSSSSRLSFLICSSSSRR